LVPQIPSDYPLYHFVKYWELKSRLPQATHTEIREFMNQYSGQFVVDRLRNDWLLLLGKQADWKTFDEQYPLFILDDDPQVSCYAIASAAAQGLTIFKEQPLQSIARATVFKQSTHLSSEGCLSAIYYLAKSNTFNQTDLYDTLHILSENKKATPNAAISQLIRWGLFNNDLITRKELDLLATSPNTFTFKKPYTAIQKMSVCGQNLDLNCSAWLNSPTYIQDNRNTLAQSTPLSERLNQRFITLPDNLSGLGSDTTLEWALRGVLRNQDWEALAYLIPRLPQHLKTTPQWVYWYARALSMLYTNDAHNQAQLDTINDLYNSIGQGLSFYNILAQEALQRPIQLPPKPILVSIENEEALINEILKRPDITRMQVFYRTGLRYEGNREWNWMVRHAPESQLHLYAKAALQLSILDRMISTTERIKSPLVAYDFNHRFPMPYIEKAQPIATQFNLDSNWVYGLMRQESRFITDVRSSVSARGLMQIMPTTAAYVAKKIGMHDYSLDQLTDISTNLTLGHAYLSMVLNDLDNSPVLATAAYNAGPGRSKTWRSRLNQTVEGAIFTETIPFNETRDYVKHVLTNATLYGALTQNNPRTLTQWLGNISPKKANITTLP
jgi:soluble lytic murein transglycosylase